MTKEDIRKINLFLFDMDGTLCLGEKPFDFSKELLDTIRDSGKKYLIMTNNSSKSVSEYVKRLERFGVTASEEDFITSSQATVFYLEQYHKNARLYVCGTDSLKEELRKGNFVITDELEEVDCIVVGYDTELTYKKLVDVSKLLLMKDIPYIATNPDMVCPTEFGSVPDCGSICDMLYNVSGKRPIVIGKPGALMPELAMKHYGYNKEETAVIGDRIYTDIKSGLNAGIMGILVLSGETTREIMDRSEDKPHLVLQNGGEMIPFLKM